MHPVWRSLGRDRVVRLFVLGAAALALPYVVPLVAPAVFDFYAGLVCEGALLLGVVGALRYPRSRTVNRQEKRFFDLTSVALLFWLGQKAVAWLPVVTPGPAAVLVQDALFAAFYACLVFAVMLRPDVGDEPLVFGPRRILEIAGTVIFALGLLAYFSGIPFLETPARLLTGLPSMVLVGVFDCLLVLRFGSAWRSTSSPRWRSIYGFFLLTIVLWLVTDGVETLMYAGVIPDVAAGTPLDLVWWLPFAGLLAGARVRAHAWGEEARPDATPAEVARGRSLVAEEAWGDTLVAYAAAFPLLHFLLYTAGVLDPATRSARETLSLGVLLVLAGLAVAYQKLRGRAADPREQPAQGSRPPAVRPPVPAHRGDPDPADGGRGGASALAPSGKGPAPPRRLHRARGAHGRDRGGGPLGAA